MSKYPRTDAARLKDVCRHMAMAEECTRMEYELNEAKARIKRMEDIISRAAYAFYRDGPDGQVASGMLTILEEVRKP